MIAAQHIPVAGPWITQKEIDYVADAAANAWYADANQYHQRFERAFAEYVGLPFAIALPSCTSAIHLSLAALGIGPGDEVVVPDITWIASAAPIQYVGATTVFADVDRKTWCLDATSFAACITPRTKAVIPVNLYGGMPNIDALREVCSRHSIFLIEDAAESIGSEYKGRKAGSFGHTSCFSFHGSKTLTTGEGGMLVTGNEALFKRALILRDHGRLPGDRFFKNAEVAYKYKMSSMQAAMGLAQLERIEELIEKKRLIFEWYKERLECLPGVTLNHEPHDVKNSYWMVTLTLDHSYQLEKTQLMDLLEEQGIDSRPFFYPLSSLPAYANSPESAQAQKRNKNAYEIHGRGVNLPSALTLTEDTVNIVCQSLLQILKEHRA